MMPAMLTDDRLSLLTDAQLKDVQSLDAMRLISSLHATATGDGVRKLSDGFDLTRAVAHFKTRWPRSVNLDLFAKRIDWLQKAATNPGTTLEPAWAAPLAAVRLRAVRLPTAAQSGSGAT